MQTSQELCVLACLPSLDLQETEKFYRDYLGFEAAVYQDETTLILKKGSIEIMFNATEDPAICQESQVYIRGIAITSLYEDLKAKNWSNAPLAKLSEFTDRPWGMREFYIQDPHGNLLCFGHEIEE